MTQLSMTSHSAAMFDTVSYLGSYHPDYARHRVIQQGLRACGINVAETHESGPLPQRWLRMLAALRDMPRHHPLIVGEAGNYLTPVLWEARRRAFPLVFDPFVSLRDSLEDRYSSMQSTLLGPIFALIDWLNNAPASAVLCDTPQMRSYFVQNLGLAANKAFVVPVGAETDLFAQVEAPTTRSGPLRVLFYGTFIPLQGIEVIIHAAALLRQSRNDIRFQLVGHGQTFAQMRKLAEQLKATNIQFGPESVPYRELPALIAQADICLGIFAKRPKTLRVIPNKLYQCAACGVPVITADTPAMRWGFRSGEIALVPPGNAIALAEMVSMLADDPALRSQIGLAGAHAVRERFNPRTIAARVVEACRTALWSI